MSVISIDNKDAGTYSLEVSCYLPVAGYQLDETSSFFDVELTPFTLLTAPVYT